MAASGDVRVTRDGGQSLRPHPYLVALVRWCVSCLWSTATVLLHRLMTSPLPQIAAKPSKSRPAGRDHLHPEPKVECVVLHQPETHSLDVVFVHGLYGSLCNTWRQGEWKSKYQIDPEKIHLRRPDSVPIPCDCPQGPEENKDNIYNSRNNFNNTENTNNNSRNCFNNDENFIHGCNSYDDAFTNIDETFYNKIKKILPKDDPFITEKFYNNTLLNQVEIVDNYEAQAKFVSDLFKNSCDSNEYDSRNVNDGNMFNNDENVHSEDDNNCRCDSKGQNLKDDDLTCKCGVNEGKPCEAGCGCICDDCYSPCWPKDWIKIDYPDARVISINYTSDPHLWRPLWIKENKRLRLHERAEQMTRQLLELGVGSRPVVWVGHSKGGLFIKQIYCEAYDAYLKTNESNHDQNENRRGNDNNHDVNQNNNARNMNHDGGNRNNNDGNNMNNDGNQNNNHVSESNKEMTDDNDSIVNMDGRNDSCMTSNILEDRLELQTRAGLWTNSRGFMFYSVPHRGSPLADIKTPITARSVELLEISKDCSLVLSLQSRWLCATASRQPLVRSLVETRRTLMSVLWLRIVSADSADPGIGALCGVSVDHREICKPTSRRCLLYTELMTLIRGSLNSCREKRTA